MMERCIFHYVTGLVYCVYFSIYKSWLLMLDNMIKWEPRRGKKLLGHLWNLSLLLLKRIFEFVCWLYLLLQEWTFKTVTRTGVNYLKPRLVFQQEHWIWKFIGDLSESTEANQQGVYLIWFWEPALEIFLHHYCMAIYVIWHLDVCFKTICYMFNKRISFILISC